MYHYLQLHFAGGKQVSFKAEDFRMRDEVTVDIRSTSGPKLENGINVILHDGNSMEVQVNPVDVQTETNAAVKEDTNHLKELDVRIGETFVGKYRINIKNCVSPSDDRLVRKVSDSHVQKIYSTMNEDPEWGVTLTGLIDNQQVASKMEFERKNLDNYIIEIVDGNHNLQALKRLQKENPEKKIERDILLYAGLSNTEAKRLGIARNTLTSQSLPMSDMDYVQILRTEIIKEYGSPTAPGKDERGKTFWNRVFPIIGLENNVG